MKIDKKRINNKISDASVDNAKKTNQRGIALVSVLISVAIITGIISSLAYQQFIQLRRTAVILHREQAIMYLFAVETYAKIVLNLDSIQNGYDWFGPSEPWGRGINNPFAGGEVEASIIELNGRFNINNLRYRPQQNETNSGQGNANINAVMHNCFERLLASVVTDSDSTTNELLASLEDWLDEDNIERKDGAEDSFYSSPTDIRGSYKPTNHLIADINELKLIKGYTEFFEKEESSSLLRQITALPSVTSTINVNTATEEILGCLEPEGRMDTTITTAIVERRMQTPFESLDDFFSYLDDNHPLEATKDDISGDITDATVPWKENVPYKYLSIKSDFALVRAQLHFGSSNLIAYSLLQRTNDGAVRILQRTFVPG